MTINNLSRHFLEEHPRESAKVLENFASDELVDFLEKYSDETVASLIRYLMPATAVACLSGMKDAKAATILEQLGVDNAARLLRRMKNKDQLALLGSVSGSYAMRLKSILRYPAGTVGQHMSPNIFIADENMLASDVFSAARHATSEMQGDIFIINDAQHLVGLVDVKNLVFADQGLEINEIMRIPDAVLNARTNLEYVKDHPKWRFKEALPVVDHNNIFVGVLKRSVMFEALSGDQNLSRSEETFMDTVMEVADLFWDICTNIV
jgi:magnesium transporter